MAARQPFTVQVKGYREVSRALRGVDKGTRRSLLDGFKEAARPVADDAKKRLARYQGASLNTIGPRQTLSSVFVTQRARKRTGKRPDFGALQMRQGLIPALEDNQDVVREKVQDAIDHLIGKEF